VPWRHKGEISGTGADVRKSNSPLSRRKREKDGATSRVGWFVGRASPLIGEPVHMNVQEQIKRYIASQPVPKRRDMQELHLLTLQVSPGCKLWFSDGKDSKNKTVSNPTIGYGLHTIKYANGKTREFFQIGLSANTTGISVYVLGLKDKTYLAKTYGKTLGKASVTGYCIKFRTLKDINIVVLEAAIRYGFEASNDKSS
jgi:hypothetical protein